MNATIYLEKQLFITLCDALKWTGWVQSGGHAKAVIAAGEVRRNGVVETRKTAKIYSDERIEFLGSVLLVRAGYPPENE